MFHKQHRIIRKCILIIQWDLNYIAGIPRPFMCENFVVIWLCVFYELLFEIFLMLFQHLYVFIVLDVNNSRFQKICTQWHGGNVKKAVTTADAEFLTSTTSVLEWATPTILDHYRTIPSTGPVDDINSDTLIPSSPTSITTWTGPDTVHNILSDTQTCDYTLDTPLIMTYIWMQSDINTWYSTHLWKIC